MPMQLSSHSVQLDKKNNKLTALGITNIPLSKHDDQPLQGSKVPNHCKMPNAATLCLANTCFLLLQNHVIDIKQQITAFILNGEKEQSCFLKNRKAIRTQQNMISPDLMINMSNKNRTGKLSAKKKICCTGTEMNTYYAHRTSTLMQFWKG
jgi:hypothetical protein